MYSSCAVSRAHVAQSPFSIVECLDYRRVTHFPRRSAPGTAVNFSPLTDRDGVLFVVVFFVLFSPAHKRPTNRFVDDEFAGSVRRTTVRSTAQCSLGTLHARSRERHIARARGPLHIVFLPLDLDRFDNRSGPASRSTFHSSFSAPDRLSPDFVESQLFYCYFFFF